LNPHVAGKKDNLRGDVTILADTFTILTCSSLQSQIVPSKSKLSSLNSPIVAGKIPMFVG